MAELEITYIPYGLDEISQLDLMTSLADGVEGYLSSKRWAKKEKNRNAWLKAYLEIINRGITGASNDTGIWRVNFNGGDFPLDTMSERDREMYHDAAYYIRQKMSLMTSRKKEDEKKKLDLKPLNFIGDFENLILKDYYNNNRSLLEDPEYGWNSLDARDEKTGLRTNTSKRREKLIEALTKYRLNFKADQYKYEGTAFADGNDVLSKIDKAIEALNSPQIDDDNPALVALGINPRNYFSNAGNDTYTLEDGTQTTYLQYYKSLADKKAVEEKLNQQKLAKLKKDAYDNTLFITRATNPKMLGKTATYLKEKYKDGKTMLAVLLKYALKDIRTLTPDEQSEIHGAYRYLANLPIDNKLLHQLLSSSSGRYKNAAPNRFRKINGIDNLVWDSVANQIIQVNTRKLQEVINNLPLDLFAGVKTNLDIQNDYMNSVEGGFTPAELREVAALLFDLGAAVDPEGVSSATLSQIASGIRDYNRASDPEGWTWGDTGWATLDHGLGLLSAIPVVGGLVKGAWATAKLGKYIPKIELWIRYVGRAGSTYAMAANAPGALNTVNKIKNGEDLSLKDYQDLAYFFIGGLGHHQLNRGNRIERSAMKARGMETSDSWLNRAGVTRTTAKTENTSVTTPTLKVKKTGEDGKVETKEIPIDESKQKILGKTKAEDLEAKAKELDIKIPEGYKIDSKSASTKTWSRENLNRYRGKANSEIFGTQTKQKQASGLKSDEEFELYLSEHNNTLLKKIFNGSNTDIRRYDRYLGNNLLVPKLQETSKTEPQKWSQEKIDKYLKNFLKFEEYVLNPKNYGKTSSKGNGIIDLLKNIKPGKYLLHDGTPFTIELNNENLIIKGAGQTISKRIGDLLEAKEMVANFIKLYNAKTPTNVTRRFSKEYIDSIKELKKKGFLFKQGGSLDTIIEDFIKNNNI